MANIDAPDLQYRPPHQHAFGDYVVEEFEVKATLTNGDVLRIRRMPKDAIVVDAWLSLSAAGGAGSTGQFGYVHVDGSAGGDANLFFAAAKDLTAGTFLRADSGKWKQLDKDSYLIFTVGGADVGGERTYKGIVTYRFKGHA